MERNEELLDELHIMFEVKEWMYRIGTERRVPDKDEIKVILDSMQEILAKEPIDGQPQIELGRLIMKKRSGKYDVFVYLGEYE